MLAWHDMGDGRSVLRPVRDARPSRRSALSCPLIMRDAFDQPVQSAANGKWYESKRGLAASHRASGNPHGQDFIELGNETMPFREHVSSERQLVEDIKEAKADIEAGRLPHVVTLDD